MLKNIFVSEKGVTVTQRCPPLKRMSLFSWCFHTVRASYTAVSEPSPSGKHFKGCREGRETELEHSDLLAHTACLLRAAPRVRTTAVLARSLLSSALQARLSGTFGSPRRPTSLECVCFQRLQRYRSRCLPDSRIGAFESLLLGPNPQAGTPEVGVPNSS